MAPAATIHEKKSRVRKNDRQQNVCKKEIKRAKARPEIRT